MVVTDITPLLAGRFPSDVEFFLVGNDGEYFTVRVMSGHQHVGDVKVKCGGGGDSIAHRRTTGDVWVPPKAYASFGAAAQWVVFG
jgi:hypothetical protein